MKAFILFVLLFQINTALCSPVPVTIEDVVEKVSKENYLVLENAERVYQKKENIKVARANLIPKLNIWKLLKLPAIIQDPRAIGDIIQDIVPFLVPANWFKLKQSKYELKAQREQYRALWANELLTAKLLFVSVFRDQKFLGLIKEKIDYYQQILDIAESRSIFSGENLNEYNMIKGRYLSLKEDIRNLENLVFSETKEFQFIAGIGGDKEIRLIAPKLAQIKDSKNIQTDKILFKALDASPEVKQYEHLLGALMKIKDQIKFSVLGASTFSSGDGPFSHIPISDGLGFGLGPSLNIAESEGRILKIQLVGAIETLKKQVNIFVNEYNSLINNYELIQERVELAESTYNSFMAQITLGGNIDPLQFIEIINSLFSSKILIMAYEFRFNDLIEKISRISFSNDYSHGPKVMEDIINEK